MSGHIPEDDDLDDEYDIWASGDEGEDTGKAPRFVHVESLDFTPEEIQNMRVDDLIRTYREVRDQLTTDRRGYKRREAAMRSHMQVLSMAMLAKAEMLGVTSFSSPFGTAFRKESTKYPITDWDAFLSWMLETKNYHTIQKRISSTAIREIAEATRQELLAQHMSDGELPVITDEQVLPPGIGIHREVEFAVRAPTASKSRR